MLKFNKKDNNNYEVIVEKSNKHIGNIVLDVDGEFYFCDLTAKASYWSFNALKQIADMLDNLNKSVIPVKEPELIVEGWAKIKRYHCVKGHIDFWSGDSSNHPDNIYKRALNMNYTVTYFRINDGKWINCSDFGVSFMMHHVGQMKDKFTAEEIYEHLKLEK